MFLHVLTRATRRQSIRHHMSHGGDLLSIAPTKIGPREPLQLGLDAARACPNILRLLELSHSVGSQYADTLSTAWHPKGLIWRYGTAGWTATPIHKEQCRSSNRTAPCLLWVSFSDDRTALAKIQGNDGYQRYVSMLRLDSKTNAPTIDGWQILREVIGGGTSQKGGTIASIVQALENYLAIEHGGGMEDKQRARELFAPEASLLAVGTSPLNEPASDWSAPSGSLLDISLDTYLEAVATQEPHSANARVNDVIVQVDISGEAAAATVHVGNGAQTTVFCDSLLLGYHSNHWKILSKTFSPRPWPKSNEHVY